MPIKRTKKHGAWMNRLEDIRSEVEAYKDGLQDKYNEKSEKWQESEKGTAELENIGDLESIVDHMQDAFNQMETLFEED